MLAVFTAWYIRRLNEQVKRELRSDTGPVSSLHNFQGWLECWRYHNLLIWSCLINYAVRYICSYIKSHGSNVTSVKAAEAMFTVMYLCLVFSTELNFSIIYVSYDSLKILVSSRIAKNEINLKCPPLHVLVWPSISICL